jgi:hypothetical protein
MAHATTRSTELTAEEWRLVSRLRDIPDGPLREHLGSLLDELMTVVRDPRCAELQADGAPCPSVTAACEPCQQVAALLASLRRQLHPA